MAEFWFYSDPHFGHDNIRRFCNRPWDTIKDHDIALITRYRELVAPGDTVIVLGDFAFRDHNRYLAQLPGNKTFIFGNHDRIPMDVLRNFTRVVGAHHCPGILELSIGGYKVSASHFPMMSWNASHHGAWHVHGHCHGRLDEPEWALRCDVGVDVWDYYPVNFELVRRKLEARMPAWEERMDKFDKEHANDLPGADTRRLRAEDIPLLTQWMDERSRGVLDTRDYQLRYGVQAKKLKREHHRTHRDEGGGDSVC